MDRIHLIRMLYYEQGKDVPTIAAETGHDRKTIIKYLDMDDFTPPEPRPRDPDAICPKLEEYKPLIDEWLEGDIRAPRKQRHTAKRVYKRLQKETDGFDCSYRLVAQYVAYKKGQMHLDNKKGYIPLEHYPGEGQADFGRASFFENGFQRDGRYLVLSFPHSNTGFLQLMYGENAECFMEGMIAIFEYIGGVPKEIWFDNSSTLVTKILKGGSRNLTDTFLRFSEHYRFSYKFMNPESGWEKGNVENKVGYVLKNFLVPVPEFKDLNEYNQKLLSEAFEDTDREHYRHNYTIRELFESDKKALISLPAKVFDCACYKTVTTNKWGKFTLEGGKHEYSVSCDHALTQVWLKITSKSVTVMDTKGNVITVHGRLYGEEKQSSMDWVPYLKAISRKPRSLFNSGLYEMMPPVMQRYLTDCGPSDRGKLLKSLCELTERTGFESAVHTVEQAVKYRATDPDSLMNLYRSVYSDVPQLPPLPHKDGIPDIAQMPVDLRSYDLLLKGRRKAI